MRQSRERGGGRAYLEIEVQIHTHPSKSGVGTTAKREKGCEISKNLRKTLVQTASTQSWQIGTELERLGVPRFWSSLRLPPLVRLPRWISRLGGEGILRSALLGFASAGRPVAVVGRGRGLSCSHLGLDWDKVGNR